MSKPPIRVLVVDDSAFVRGLLARIIDGQPDMRCVGTAPDPVEAREMIRTLNPDVLTLDVEMPRMDGLEFLSRLMRLRPMPVVMVSTLTERGADVTLKALALGAIDFVAKPRMAGAAGMMDAGRELAEKIRVAAQARVQRLNDDAQEAVLAAATPRRTSPVGSPPPAARAGGGAARDGAPAPRKRALPSAAVAALSGEAAASPAPAAPAAPATPAGARGAERILFIGASTGGTEATLRVLMGLPADGPAVLISQHMPPGFTTSYAARLDGLCALRVKEAVDGDRVMAGHAYVAPGGRHLAIERVGSGYVTRVTDDEPVNLHRPSVEVLFRSAARHVGRNALGVMLTGMGGDGARAMREMRDAGAWNICQDEATCVVFGMPREAIAQGAAQEVLPLPRIAARVMEKFRGGSSSAAPSAPAAGAAGKVAADH